MFVSCTDGRSPSCPGVGWSPEQGLLRGGAEPSCPPAILVLHILPRCPSAGELCCFSPLDTGTTVTSAALNSFAEDTKTPFTFLQGQFRNQQQRDKHIPQLSVTYKTKKPHNGYKKCENSNTDGFNFTSLCISESCQHFWSFKRGS